MTVAGAAPVVAAVTASGVAKSALGHSESEPSDPYREQPAGKKEK